MIVGAREKTDEVVKLISQFQKGDIKPISFGNDGLGQWLNSQMLGGLLPGTIFSIAGGSGMGKTYFLQRIENNILANEKDVVLLRVAWESSLLRLLLRRIKQKTGLSMSHVLYNKQNEEDRERIKEVVDEERNDNVFILEKIVDPEEFYTLVSAFLKEHKDKKVVISIDHIFLVRGRSKDAVDALIGKMNMLKKEHDFVCFIPLLQLERSRMQDRIGNHQTEGPRRSDIFGSDDAYMVSDGLIVVNNPYSMGAKNKYMVFPPNKYRYIDDKFKTSQGSSKWVHFIPENNMFFHLLKIRDIEDISDVRDVYVERLYDDVEGDEYLDNDKGKEDLMLRL